MSSWSRGVSAARAPTPRPSASAGSSPSIWRYRKPLAHVLVASLFVQIFALVTPIFFQVVVDKVLTHKGYSTLYVLVAGLALIGIFDVVLQYLRTYALSHTTNRIDVELGQRLFRHLLRLPISYFETRPAGQTVARVRELENIRSFLTGQALFSALDFVFIFVFIAVLFAYSWKLTLIVLASIPLYLAIGFLVRPPLREKVKEKFNRGAASQQFLVETVVGMQTVKSAAVEPLMQVQWEERLAAYVRTSFQAGLLGAGGQQAIQYVSKLMNALLLLFGAYSVINGDLTVGALVAFNMISGQAIQPILRLSQLWQDFQQVQVSVERLGDILNMPPERTSTIADRAAAAARRHRRQTIAVPLPAGRPGNLEGHLAFDPGRRGRRHRWSLGLRQVDADQTDPTPLHARRGADHARRRRSLAGRSGLAAQPYRRRPARKHPLQPHDPRQHRVRQSRHAARPGHRHRQADRRRRIHFETAARLRYRSSKSAAPISPAGSASASRSPARLQQTRRSSSSTRRPARSITRASA